MIRSASVAVAGLILALAAPTASSAQGSLPEIPRLEPSSSPVEALKSEFDTVNEIVTSVRGQISEATERLEAVANSDGGALEAQVKAMFDEVQRDLELIVNETRPNSDFRRALSRAREQTMVFKQDLERRSPDHANRDQNIARLEKLIVEYETLGADLDERGQAALDAMLELSRRQNEIVDQIRLDEILQAQDAVRDVISGLKVLADTITELEPPSFDDAVIN